MQEENRPPPRIQSCPHALCDASKDEDEEESEEESAHRRHSSRVGFAQGPEGDEPHHIPSDDRLRKIRKLVTLPDLQPGRFIKCFVPPEARARLHDLHEKQKRAKGEASDEIKDDELNVHWGKHGSWHVFPELPLREEPMNPRSFQVLPANRTTVADVFIRSQGVAVYNAKGRKYPGDTTVGQDALSVSQLSAGWGVIAVFDGHGPHGEWPALRAARSMPYVLEKAPGCVTMLKQGQAEAALHHAFDKVQRDLRRTSLAKDVDLQVTGCTAACILTHPTEPRLWVATAGDSRAALLVPGRGVVAQTCDHKPSVKAERERVERCGGEVFTQEHEDGFIEERINILGEAFPGLCMTRSLGDLAMKDYGVIAEPTVVSWQAVSEALILVASDGVWEFLTTDQVGSIVLDALALGATYSMACAELVEQARRRWEEAEDEYCDDISVVLAMMPHHKQNGIEGNPCCHGLHFGLSPSGSMKRAAGCSIM